MTGAGRPGEAGGEAAEPQDADLGGLTPARDESRRAAGLLAAALAALAVFGLGLLAAFELYERLLRGSPLALALLLVIFGVLGGYGGWLLGVIVFAAVRRPAEPEEELQSNG